MFSMTNLNYNMHMGDWTLFSIEQKNMSDNNNCDFHRWIFLNLPEAMWIRRTVSANSIPAFTFASRSVHLITDHYSHLYSWERFMIIPHSSIKWTNANSIRSFSAYKHSLGSVITHSLTHSLSNTTRWNSFGLS